MAVWNRGFSKALQTSEIDSLKKTGTKRDSIPQKQADKACFAFHVGGPAEHICPAIRFGQESRNKDAVHEFITVGHLDAWRGFDLIIEALPEVITQNSKIHSTDRRKLVWDKAPPGTVGEKICFGIFCYIGSKVSMNMYRDLMRNADVVVNAALKKGAVTCSMQQDLPGKPLICLVYDTAIPRLFYQ